jgi:hypothetical protein
VSIAEPSISSQAGNKCSRDRFISDSSKRQKTVDVLLEENTVHRAKLVNKVKDAFHKEYVSIKPNEVGWNRKFQNESLQSEILEIIDQEIADTLRINPSSSSNIMLTEIFSSCTS